MIIVKLISGLGNQLFQYAIGRHLSLKMNVPLKLDISFYQSQDLRAFKLHHFNIAAAIATDFEIQNFLEVYSSKSILAKFYRKGEKYFPKYKRRYFRESEPWVYEPEVKKITDDILLEGYWQNYKYFSDLNPIVIDELQLKDSNNYYTKPLYQEIVNNPFSVAVHVRRGDYVSDPDANNMMGILSNSYYEVAFDVMQHKLKNPVYYFFSDDLDWVKENLSVNARAVFVEPDKDYIELDLMSKCSHHIIANSSFSWWGAFLNKNPYKIIISPNRWVNSIEVNSKVEIQLPTWIKL